MRISQRLRESTSTIRDQLTGYYIRELGNRYSIIRDYMSGTKFCQARILSPPGENSSYLRVDLALSWKSQKNWAESLKVRWHVTEQLANLPENYSTLLLKETTEFETSIQKMAIKTWQNQRNLISVGISRNKMEIFSIWFSNQFCGNIAVFGVFRGGGGIYRWFLQ